MRKIALILVSIAMVILLAGCAQEAEEVRPRTYAVQKMALPDGFTVSQPNLSLFTDKSAAETFAQMIITSADSSMIRSISTLTNGAEDTEIPADTAIFARHNLYGGGYTFVTDSGFVRRENGDKDEVFAVPLTELFDEDTASYSITALILDDDENVYISTSNRLTILSADGELLGSLVTDKHIRTAACTRNGDVIVGLSESGRDIGYDEIRLVDRATFTWGDKIEIPAELKQGLQTFFTGKGYDMYYSNSNAVYGINFANPAEASELLVWSTMSNLNANIAAMVAVSPDHFICLLSQGSAYEPISLVLEATMYYGKAEKVVLATTGLHPYNSIDLFNFNAEYSQKINVELRDYSRYLASDGSNDIEVMMMMYNDIIAGEQIDLVEIGWYSDEYKSLVRQGAFCDLYEFLDKSTNLSSESLMDFVRTPFEYNGELPFIATDYNIFGLIGQTKNLSGFGLEDGMTAQELINLSESVGDDKQLFSISDGSNLLSKAGRAGYTDFIDYESATCTFESKLFIDFLNLAMKLNKSEFIEYSPISMKEDIVIFDELYNPYRTFLSYMIMKYKLGDGNEVSYVGYPSAEGRAMMINPHEMFAVMKSSEVKDSAWRFIEYILSPDSQRYVEIDGSGADMAIPVISSVLEKIEEQSVGMIITRYWEDQSEGHITYHRGPFTEEKLAEFTSDKYETPLMATQEDFDEFFSYYENVSMPALYDTMLTSIVLEEASMMFAGDKSPEETARIIQNRVSIYLQERK